MKSIKMTQRRKDPRVKVNWPIAVSSDNRTIEGESTYTDGLKIEFLLNIKSNLI